MKNKSVPELISELRKHQSKIDKIIDEIESKSNRGWCEECGEDFDLKPEWRYNTHCGECGHPIPKDKILIRPVRKNKSKKKISIVKKISNWLNEEL